MNIVEVNQDALRSAVLAVVGQTTADLISKVFDVIDLAERRGHSAGFDVGYNHGYVAQLEGYQKGFDEGRAINVAADYAEGRKDGYNQGFEDGAVAGSNAAHATAYDDGYEQARRDLGECPTVDAEWDDDDYEELPF